MLTSWLFKNDFGAEAYLKSIMNFKHRNALAKFRSSVAPIRPETGCYEHFNVDERICPICNTEVESEEHVLTRCHAYTWPTQVLDMNLYADARADANDINADFNNMNDCDKMCFTLVNPTNVKTCYEILCHSTEEFYCINIVFYY